MTSAQYVKELELLVQNKLYPLYKNNQNQFTQQEKSIIETIIKIPQVPALFKPPVKDNF